MLKKILFSIKYNKIVGSKYKINSDIAIPIILNLELFLKILCEKEYKKPAFKLERIFFLYALCYKTNFNVRSGENIRLYFDLWFRYYRLKFEKELGISEVDQLQLFINRNSELWDYNVFIKDDDLNLTSENNILDKVILYWNFLPLAKISNEELMAYKLIEISKNKTYYLKRAKTIEIISKIWPKMADDLQNCI